MKSGVPLLLVIFLAGIIPAYGGELADFYPPKAPGAEHLNLENSSFAFARLIYSTADGRRASWAVDYPDADLGLIARLRELTTVDVSAESVVVELTDRRLRNYRFAYMVEPGSMRLTDAEVAGLRAYLEGGGFLMLDDFWGQDEWTSVAQEFRRVLPDREIVDLSFDHPVFHFVFDLPDRPQVPGIGPFRQGKTYEKDGREVHYRAIFDDKARMMVILCHNTDLGDGWSTVPSSSDDYHVTHGVAQAIPMGINIVAYALSQDRSLVP